MRIDISNTPLLTTLNTLYSQIKERFATQGILSFLMNSPQDITPAILFECINDLILPDSIKFFPDS
ncbi:hypothetical protein WN50_26510 [Limnoraphis robusta CS-951]|uniref:Uncharacterized protein n=1 Tax=Limnoraphis robusta CS-951 TaxID=1637645 RepID=A0A0F5Y8N3_9CYAN|nr:hypothetical protein WN50_26510 [Limnoraphis robusta CS-951]